MKKYYQETTNYGMFKFSRRNREVKNKPRKDLLESIERYGQLDPIVVNKQLVVVKGQHRLVVCKHLGIPVKYVIDPEAKVAHMAESHRVTHKWNPLNFIQTNYDKPSYQLFGSYLDKSGLSSNALHYITKGIVLSNGSKKQFESSKLEFGIKEIRAYREFEPILSFVRNYNGGQFANRLLKTKVLPAMSDMGKAKNFSLSRFKVVLKNSLDHHIKSVNRDEDARRMLQDLYNRGLTKGRRISIIGF